MKVKSQLTARYEAMREFLNFEYSPVLKRFIPENPWHGGPPHNSSTSPFCGNFFPLCMGSTPSMTFLRRRLQSSVKTVHEGLFFLNALAAGSQTSMAQWESATPAWNKTNLNVSMHVLSRWMCSKKEKCQDCLQFFYGKNKNILSRKRLSAMSVKH